MGSFKDGIIISTTAFIIALVVFISPLNDYDIAGMAYAGFSDPISTYTFNTNTNLVSVSDSAVYKYGYYSVNGGDWVPFNLTGSPLGGAWLTGTATRLLPDFGVGEHYVVIYSCTYVNRQWDCHGNEWQLIAFNSAKINSGSNISIYATGSFGDNSYPTMELIIDDTVVSSWIVDGDVNVATYKVYAYTHQNIIIENDVVRVNFPNDVYGSDRDLRVDKIVIDGKTYESEAQNNVNTGLWDGTNCGGIPYPGNELLPCIGYIQYNLSPIVSCTPSCSGKQCGTDGCGTNNNCGTCTNTHGTTSCSTAGLCQPSCTSGYGNCDGNAANGCETNLLTSTNNCGSCGRACSGTCSNGQCTTTSTGSITNTPKGSRTTYYVSSSSGSDSNNGLSESAPWKTIAQVNKQTFYPGDTILFKRGDTWNERLIITSSGSITAPITYGIYGTSTSKPLISGLQTLSGWTSEGNGIYSAGVSCDNQTNMVLIDGKQYAMGRYPNSVNLTYESHNADTAITDSQLTGSPDWTGAEAVINKWDWIMDRCRITQHSGNTLAYTCYGEILAPYNGREYFIQNDLRTVDLYGEWYHNMSSGKVYMYFGSTAPTSKTVQVARLNNLIYGRGKNYITIDGISLSGSIDDALYGSGTGWTIKNCLIKYSGGNCITSKTRDSIITYNDVSYCNEVGIYGESSNITIIKNVIKDIGMCPGQAYAGTMSQGIHCTGSSGNLCYVLNNFVNNTAYNGIMTASTVTALIKNNFVNYPVQLLDDGAGIYTGGNNTVVKRVIEGNIVLNAGAKSSGTLIEGIYLDESPRMVFVNDNTVANSRYSGIKVHNIFENVIVENNTFFNNSVAGMFLQNTDSSRTMNFNNIFRNNTFFARESSQLTLRGYSGRNDIASLGISDYNYFIKPISGSNLIQTYEPATGYKYRTMADWRSTYNLDQHSRLSPVSSTNLNEIIFEYNPSDSIKTITLPSGDYVDVNNKTYSGSINIRPWDSIILMKKL